MAPTLHVTIAMSFAGCTKSAIFGTKPTLCTMDELKKATLDPEYEGYKAMLNIPDTNLVLIGISQLESGACASTVLPAAVKDYGVASDVHFTLMVYFPTPSGHWSTRGQDFNEMWPYRTAPHERTNSSSYAGWKCSVAQTLGGRAAACPYARPARQWRGCAASANALPCAKLPPP